MILRTAVLFVFFTSLLTADIHLLEGDVSRSYHADIGFNITPQSGGSFQIDLSEYQTYDQELTFSQIISNHQIKFNTPISVSEPIFDEFGNKIRRYTFKPKAYKGRWQTFSCEISFDAVLTASLRELDSSAFLPIAGNIPSAINPQYLNEASGVLWKNRSVENKAIELTAGISRTINAVRRILLWCELNIAEIESTNRFGEFEMLTADKRYFDSDRVLNDLKGSRSGKLNLSAAMIRSLGVPVRFAGGLSLDRNFQITFTNIPVSHYTAKQESIWIEIWIEGAGWLPAVPDESLFFLFPSILKQKHAPSLQQLRQFDRTNKKFTCDILYEPVKNSLSSTAFKAVSNIQKWPSFIFIAPLLADEKKSKYSNSIFNFTPPDYSKEMVFKKPWNGHLIEEIKLKANSKSGTPAQRIIVPADFSNSIFLLMYKLSDNGGNVKLKLISEKNLIAGEPAAYSSSESIRNMKYLAKFYWYEFKFPGSTSIAPGEYWVIPEISGASILHWAFLSGSTWNSDSDAVQLGENGRINTIFNGDFGIKLKK